MEAEVGMWSLDITNLSGSIIRAKVPLGYGGSNGVWRHTRISREKPGQNVIGVRLYWMNASLRRGIFRIQTQMSVKYSTHTDSHDGSEAFVAAQASMKHELSILAQLKHSNVGSLWGYEEDTYGSMRMPAIVTEFYENGSLHEYISRHSQELSTPKRIELMENILKGLNYLHEQVAKGPVVHGNLNMVRYIYY
ncbi:hypothetical protein BDV93DRAFT_561495 [Ceratobasidium sp. AG-I]|nr:hypothetical protein BDV93DRAFT_561495 [Ceratobasidium sp. AG-I]